MKIKFVFLVVVVGVLVCLAMKIPAKTITLKPTLKKIAVIDLPGEIGKRFDYLTIDYKHNYLLSAHLGANVLYVIDTKTNKLVKMISDTPGAEGVEYVEELNKVYTSNWKDHSIGVIDMNKMEVVKKIPALEKPDGNIYATHFKKLYVSDERGKTLIIVDVNKDEVVKKILFKSETGMPQYDSVAKKIYLNLQDENMFVVIDPKNDSIIGRYPVGDCKGNHGMALDVEHRLAFLACEGNDLLTVFNLTTFKPVAYLKMAGGSDVVKYDAGLKRIYVACYDGFISVFHEDDPTHFTKLEDFSVQKKVHSLTVDKYTHRVYAPEQEEDGKPVSRMVIYDAVQ
jgi:DNA-binding beta-propeller fold protein YncE